MSKISIHELKSFSDLLSDRERKMKQLVGQLTINEVRDQEKFDESVNHIKKQGLLIPATVGEPEIIGNFERTKKVPPHYAMPRGGNKTYQVVNVSFPISGSKELFQVRTGEMLSMEDFYLPSNNSITMEIEVERLEKGIVLDKALQAISNTKQLLSQNNPHAEVWSKQIVSVIDAYAEKKRKEIIDLYS